MNRLLTAIMIFAVVCIVVPVVAADDSDAATTYTVTFDLRGGTSGPDDMSYGPTSATSHTFTIPDEVPLRNGWGFLAWNSSQGGTYYPGDRITVTSSNPDVTLMATWSSSTYTYTVTFDDNGGSGGPSDLSYGPTGSTSHVFDIPDDTPSRSGYNFEYWDSDVNERHVYPGGALTVSSDNPDVTLTAVWSEDVTYYTYEVVFNDNGGTGGPSDLSYGPTTSTSHTFTIPNTEPVRDGWTFLYWGASSGGTYDPGDRITVRSSDTSVTLTAAWSMDTYTYTVTFDDNGGTGGPSALSFGPTTSTSHVFDIPDDTPSRPGYTFQYWDSDVNERHVYPGGALTVSSDNPDVTLTAVWEEITYTYSVIFELRDGTGAPDNLSYGPTTDTSHTFTIPDTTPVREGWTFLYWGTDSTVTYDPGDEITLTSADPSITLIAAWGMDTYTYTVTFDPNGGEGGPDNLIFGPTTSTAHTFDIPEEIPTREGYTFLRWESSELSRPVVPGGALTLSSDIPDVTLTAVWEEITYTYTVTFDPNGGAGGPDDLTYGPTPSISHTFTIPDDEPELAGSIFDGWLLSGLDPQVYEPGEQITVTSDNPDVTLTAVWASATGIYISISGTTSATVGDTRTVTAVVLPSDIDNKGVTWRVTAGASLIDYDTEATWRGGTLTYTALEAGTVTITVASLENPDAMDVITITITAAPSDDPEVIGPGGIVGILGDVLFGGSSSIAGVVLFAIILAVLFAIIREPLPVVLLGIPVLAIFTLLGILDMDMVILLIIVVTVGLALIARKMWRD